MMICRDEFAPPHFRFTMHSISTLDTGAATQNTISIAVRESDVGEIYSSCCDVLEEYILVAVRACIRIHVEAAMFNFAINKAMPVGVASLTF
jgi:hypothetical protein